MFEFTAENLAMISTAGGIVSSICFFLWKKLIKPAINLMDDHQEIKKSIDIIKNEVDSLSGSIEVLSTEGKGTQFIIELPILK